MNVQDRFDRAVDLMAVSEDATPYEYDVDEKADKLRIAQTGDTYSWTELPEHVRDHWREQASR